MNTTRIIAALFCVPICWAADSVPADNSGNALLKGKYWVREILPLPRACFSGAMTFDGKGAYQFTGQLLEQTGLSHKTELHQVTLTGTYRVGASGIVAIDNLSRSADYILEVDSVLLGGLGSNGVVTASDTDSDFNDLFVGIPAARAVPQNAQLQGAYWIGHLDYGNGPGATGAPKTGRNSLFQVNADGKGGFADVTITGHDVTQNDKQLTQVVKSASYNFIADGSATVNFPTPARRQRRRKSFRRCENLVRLCRRELRSRRRPQWL